MRATTDEHVGQESDATDNGEEHRESGSAPVGRRSTSQGRGQGEPAGRKEKDGSHHEAPLTRSGDPRAASECRQEPREEAFETKPSGLKAAEPKTGCEP
jgi:hypothetical protein